MKKSRYIFPITALIILILDQLTKSIVSGTMSLQQSIPLIKNILHLTYTTNTGAAFGILKNMNYLLTYITIIVIGIILYNYDKLPKNKFPQITAALILGGAIGNLISRIFLGHVIDFIDFRIWPSFNIADSAITTGAIGLIIYFWKK